MAAIVGTSTGYVGTSPAPSITSEEWAKFQAAFGTEYFVASDVAARVTVVSGLTVRVGSGASPSAPQYIGGGGVVDELTGPVNLTLPAPASDGTTYRPVYARRTWQTTNATTFEYGNSLTTRSLPSRANDPGKTTDEHPLALVRIVKSGATLTATVVDDLRAVGWAQGDYEATSELVLQYMNKPGYRVRIAGVEWLRTMGGTWEKAASPIVQVSNFGGSESGWSGGSTVNQSYMFAEGRRRTMWLEQRRTQGTITPSGTGHIGNVATFQLAAEHRPVVPVMCAAMYLGVANADYGCVVQINPNGYVFLTHLTAGAALQGGVDPGGWSLRITGSWYTA